MLDRSMIQVDERVAGLEAAALFIKLIQLRHEVDVFLDEILLLSIAS